MYDLQLQYNNTTVHIWPPHPSSVTLDLSNFSTCFDHIVIRTKRYSLQLSSNFRKNISLNCHVNGNHRCMTLCPKTVLLLLFFGGGGRGFFLYSVLLLSWCSSFCSTFLKAAVWNVAIHYADTILSPGGPDLLSGLLNLAGAAEPLNSFSMCFRLYGATMPLALVAVSYTLTVKHLCVCMKERGRESAEKFGILQWICRVILLWIFLCTCQLHVV